MASTRVLIFGSSLDLAAPLAGRVRTLLKNPLFREEIQTHWADDPSHAIGEFDAAILIWNQSSATELQPWKSWLEAQGPSFHLGAFCGPELSSEIQSLLSPRDVVVAPQSPDLLLRNILGRSINHGLGAPPTDIGSQSLSAISLSLPAELSLELPSQESSKISLGTESPETESLLSTLDQASGLGPVAGDVTSTKSSHMNLEFQIESQPKAESATGLWGLSPKDLQNPLGVGVRSVDVSVSPSPVMTDDPVLPSLSVTEAESKIEEPLVMPPPLGSASSEEVETLRRYATLKERESREKDTTIQILQKKIEQVLEKLEKSETERRRLTLAMDEAEVHRRTLEEERDQAKHSIARLENTQQEEMRAFQLRLDNAQFQATRSEKKLEDFRERVRMDIQKIRSRERELANRLELQKRDAEALLSAKDERLLGHKREIDRLEFEVETLRNRLLEQTERAEERVGKLTRALRALKMAEGMLSGIEDEVLPAAAGGDAEGTGEAA